MYVCKDDNTILFSCYCLELPDLKNKNSISRIPSGTYIGKKRWSSKYKDHLHITNVINRRYILIHPGNTYKDTRGCILVGKDLRDINNDSHLDLVNSKATLKKILPMLQNTFNIEIYELEEV